MYGYVCANGHASGRNELDVRAPGECPHPRCDMDVYAVVSGEDALAEGCNPHDCTRGVVALGARLELHLRTGLAYNWGTLVRAKHAEIKARQEASVPVPITEQREVIELQDGGYSVRQQVRVNGGPWSG